MNRANTLCKHSIHGRVDKVKHCLRRGYDVNGQSTTTLGLSGNNETLYSILNDRTNWTALHFAAFYEHEKVVTVLLSFDANPNLKDDAGCTPLHVASFFGNIDIVKLLLAKGANYILKDAGGLTALDVARRQNQSSVVDLFTSGLAEAFPRNHRSERHVIDVLPVSNQVGGTCYAHAVATAIIATENRIIGRSAPRHDQLVDQIVNVWGSNGAIVAAVLQRQCRKRHLKFSIRSAVGVVEAIEKDRIVVAGFHLDGLQWDNFSNFFSNYDPSWVIEKSDIDKITKPHSTLSPDDILQLRTSGSGGHAVAIVAHGQNDGKRYWRIKNSWGTSFADCGYFHVAREALDGMTFYDVYFRICDLPREQLVVKQPPASTRMHAPAPSPVRQPEIRCSIL